MSRVRQTLEQEKGQQLPQGAGVFSGKNMQNKSGSKHRSAHRSSHK